MPTCARCGEFNPDNATICNKCGISLGFQSRAKADEARARTGKLIRIVLWIVVAVLIAIAAPPAYHAAGVAYYKHHLKSMQDRAMSNCNGPVTATTPPYEKLQIERCLAADEDYVQAQRDYDSFTKGSKR